MYYYILNHLELSSLFQSFRGDADPSTSTILTIHKGRKNLLHAAQLEQVSRQGQNSRSWNFDFVILSAYLHQ